MKLSDFISKNDKVLLYNYDLENHDYKYILEDKKLSNIEFLTDFEIDIIIIKFKNTTNVNMMLKIVNILFNKKLKLILIDCPYIFLH